MSPRLFDPGFENMQRAACDPCRLSAGKSHGFGKDQSLAVLGRELGQHANQVLGSALELRQHRRQVAAFKCRMGWASGKFAIEIASQPAAQPTERVGTEPGRTHANAGTQERDFDQPIGELGVEAEQQRERAKLRDGREQVVVLRRFRRG